ncbi:hypothetical protein F5Y16DRAFT_370590 [Xylariaceae sp. FL0255]|nr:hypothetical protein F5Y16DRAFT_370590 [Xylariaceae sp. FL0255]
MTEVVPVDHTKLLQSKRAECSAIARSRKRKLCILYEVTLSPDGIPNHSFANPDAYNLTPAEAQFLDGCDILQGRRLNELNIPSRPPRPPPTYTKGQPVSQPASKANVPPRPIKAPVIAPIATTASPSPEPSPVRIPPSPGDGLGKDVEPVVPSKAKDSTAAADPATVASLVNLGEPDSFPKPGSQQKESRSSKESGGQDANLSPSPMDVDPPVPHTPSSNQNSTGPLDHTRSIDISSGATPIPVAPTPGVETKAISSSSNQGSSDKSELQVHTEAQKSMSEKAALDQQTTSQVEAQLVQDSADAARRDSARLESNLSMLERVPSLPSNPPKKVDVRAANAMGAESAPSISTSGAPSDSQPTKAEGLEHQDALKTVSPVPTESTGEKSQSKTDDQATTMHIITSKPPQTILETSPTSPVSNANQDLLQGTASITSVALQKPVAEILGERLEPMNDYASHPESQTTQSMPITPTSQSSKLRSQSLVEKAKPKDKAKMSTVVFGKQPQRGNASQSLIQKTPSPDHLSDDYFTALFVNSFASGSKWMKPLDHLLHQAHKTVSTPDSYTQFLDHQACRVLRRIYILQQNDKWSFRQPKRSPEPVRQTSHWDLMMQEMKWMRTDFREERKWKMTVARNLANACADWVLASEEERKAMQVNAVIPPRSSRKVEDEDVFMADAESSPSPENQPTPDLIPSNSTDSPLEPDDILDDDFPQTVAPSAIFALQDEDVVFALQPSAATDRLLEELPMYGAPLEVPKSDLFTPKYDPDASWKRPALPLSKFAEGVMELTSIEPPKKKSRYHHAQEGDDEHKEIIFGQDDVKMPQLPPQSPNVALFRTENKSIRDRLHAGHQFRPPSEHNMPTLAFYESRVPSTWLQSEDDELKGLVREYSYNWSLISRLLSAKSLYVSATERRSPWECFERWVMLEGLPHDMQKTQYFKLWQSRIEQAQQYLRQQQQLMSQQQMQQQALQQAQSQNQSQSQPGQQSSQAGTNVPTTPLAGQRRVYPYSLPVRIPRRRNGKHYIMLESMRKIAKKREAAAQKAQQNAQLAAARKANEAPQAKPPSKTPREYSIMRWERDQALAEKVAERMAAQQRQHEAARRAAAMQRVQQNQIAQIATATQGAGQLPQGTSQMAASHPHSAAAMVRTANVSNQMAANGQSRPRMAIPMPSTPSGGTEHQNHMAGGLVPPMQMAGSPQIQVPVVNGQAQMSMPASVQNRMLLQAQQISEQQRQSVQQQMRQRQIQQQQMQQQQSQQQSQQLQAQHSPPPQHQQQQHQHQQQALASQQMNGSLQTSPPGMRAAVINGLNQRNYMSNAQAQAIMASYNAANGAGSSTSTAGGLSVVNGQAGSPRPNAIVPPQTNTTYVSQLQAIENQIRSNHPDAPQDKVREMARALLQSRHNSLAQSAMSAAAGSAGHTAFANGPHQYAQLLRAQQQQQAAAAAAKNQAQAQAAQAQSQAQAAQAQAQTAAQTSTPQAQIAQHNAQHQRNSSGSATPTPSISQ